MSNDIRRIQVTLSDEWTLSEQSARHLTWEHLHGVALEAFLTGKALPGPTYSDDDSTRSFCREIAAERGAGILQVVRFSIDGAGGFWSIDKGRQALAYTYAGHLHLPLPDDTFHMRLGIMESGLTGARDAYVSTTLLSRGEVKIVEYEKKAPDGAVGGIEGWRFDPYDSGYDGFIMNTKADSEIWDSDLPRDPLSWLRAFMKELPDRIALPRERS